MSFFTWKDKGLTSDCSSLEAMASRFDQEKPYEVKYGDRKKGKVKSIMLYMNGVYHEAIKNLLLSELKRSWTKVLNNGWLKVDFVKPMLDRAGVLEKTQIKVEWSSGKLKKEVTTHVYHTTKNVHIQGGYAEEFWTKVVKPLFDNLIENNDKLKRIQLIAKSNPIAAAAAATAALGADKDQVINELRGTTTEQKLAIDREMEKPERRRCDVCKKIIAKKDTCNKCGGGGHQRCGFLMERGKCKPCRNEEVQKRSTTATLESVTELLQENTITMREDETPPPPPTSPPIGNQTTGSKPSHT